MNQDMGFLPKYVYVYQHVDELAFIHSPAQVQSDTYGAEGIVDLIPFIDSLFKRKGWEGDGEIGLMWIPPFIMDDRGTSGVFVWFVKQGNNGTAFIGSSIPLPFQPIQEQN